MHIKDVPRPAIGLMWSACGDGVSEGARAAVGHAQMRIVHVRALEPSYVLTTTCAFTASGRAYDGVVTCRRSLKGSTPQSLDRSSA